ncbi:lysophospholipid acyltransferase family protein [Lacticaseibacillus jixianensis]|uniref:Lysophospholipid acyltransferase family protein n=1 Tax=Lacticaseibacillus jixianensis TaxID=2486012 RepID=A0ABW4BEX0_9LACO|nr:1-acyl-sn-glycerol-3-phosphate acyltransferase [Lacticaseibacillus jixianensis]
MVKPRVQEYTDFDTDLVTNRRQHTPLPATYQWAHSGPWYRLKSAAVYHTMKQVGRLYWYGRLHVRFVGREKLAPFRHQAYFLYGNHTQPFGDPFMPMLLAGPQRASTLGAAANLGVPVFGPLLQLGGGVILPETAAQTRRFLAYLKTLVARGHPVAVYPEAHVWPYATQIRPFALGAFHYPVAFSCPVFAFTTTYQRGRTTVYVDGPFQPDRTRPAAEQRAALATQVHEAMAQRAKASTEHHVIYRRRPS